MSGEAGTKRPRLPHGNDVHACTFLQLELANGAADQRRVMHREIGDF
jgi:hypothetical protein